MYSASGICTSVKIAAHKANKRKMRNALRLPAPGSLFPCVGTIDGRTGDGSGESMSGTSKLFFDASAGEFIAVVRRRDIFGGFCRDEIIIFDLKGARNAGARSLRSGNRVNRIDSSIHCSCVETSAVRDSYCAPK